MDHPLINRESLLLLLLLRLVVVVAVVAIVAIVAVVAFGNYHCSCHAAVVD